MRNRSLVLFLVFSGFFVASGSQDKPAFLEVVVSYVPRLVNVDGHRLIYYELQAKNISSDTVQLTKVMVSDHSTGEQILSFQGNALEEKLVIFQRGLKQSGKTLPPGMTAFVYIEAVVTNEHNNIELRHAFEFTSLNMGVAKSHVTRGPTVRNISDNELMIGAPLASGSWAAVYEPSWERGHRRVIYTEDSTSRIPGRFAIDFILLDGRGRYSTEDTDSITNWFGYGQEVLAVADGIVASTRDDFSESLTLSGHPKYSSKEATGNYISIDIDGRNIAFYEHLKPGSVRVKPGDLVKEGDVLAQVGFTGQSTGPHLHFHIANANSPLGAEGVAFAFKKFKQLGKYDDFEQFGRNRWSEKNQSSTGIRTKERPSPYAIIEFMPSGF